MTDTPLKSTVTVGISRSEGCYVASFVEIAAVTQARTFDELVHNLREIVHLHLEDEDPAFRIGDQEPFNRHDLRA